MTTKLRVRPRGERGVRGEGTEVRGVAGELGDHGKNGTFGEKGISDQEKRVVGREGPFSKVERTWSVLAHQ